MQPMHLNSLLQKLKVNCNKREITKEFYVVIMKCTRDKRQIWLTSKVFKAFRLCAFAFQSIFQWFWRRRRRKYYSGHHMQHFFVVALVYLTCLSGSKMVRLVVYCCCYWMSTFFKISICAWSKLLGMQGKYVLCRLLIHLARNTLKSSQLDWTLEMFPTCK